MVTAVVEVTISSVCLYSGNVEALCIVVRCSLTEFEIRVFGIMAARISLLLVAEAESAT